MNEPNRNATYTIYFDEDKMEGQKAKLQRWPPKELLGSCRQSHTTTQAFVEMEIESFVYRSVPLELFRCFSTIMNVSYYT